MWSKYTGVLIWKTQNPWTGLRGQLYDHLHDQTAGFFGCRRAAEPIHVQFNLATYFVEVNMHPYMFLNIQDESRVESLNTLFLNRETFISSATICIQYNLENSY